ncbi:MAG: hypothetical protein QM786_08465 [Breznakibacter sp.]
MKHPYHPFKYLNIPITGVQAYRKVLGTAILALLLPLTLSAQENRVNGTLEEIRMALSAGKPVRANEEVLFKPGNEMFVFTRIGPWMQDSVETVRSEAVSICARLGLKTGEAAFRQEAVRMLVRSCRSGDVSLQGTALNYLTYFLRQDFTRDACDTIRVMLQAPSLHREKLVRLAGFLDLKDQMPFLESLLDQPSTKLQWNAHLALARMGSESSATAVLLLVKDYPVDDHIMYHVLPDLVYTRQKAIFGYLLEILDSDERNCTSPNPYYSGNIPCGYRVMEELAKVVVGFPLKTNKSGEMATDDYEKALQTSRKWFGEHKDYGLDRDTY